MGEVFPEAKYQRYTVHFYRNVFSVTPRSKVKLAAKMLKAIHAQESRKAAREKAKAVVEGLCSMKLKEAAKKVEDGIEETLTYCDFPSEHWARIRTNNVIARLNQEIRRRREWQQMGQQLHKYENLLNREFHADRPNRIFLTPTRSKAYYIYFYNHECIQLKNWSGAAHAAPLRLKLHIYRGLLCCPHKLGQFTTLLGPFSLAFLLLLIMCPGASDMKFCRRLHQHSLAPAGI